MKLLMVFHNTFPKHILCMNYDMIDLRIMLETDLVVVLVVVKFKPSTRQLFRLKHNLPITQGLAEPHGINIVNGNEGLAV